MARHQPVNAAFDESLRRLYPTEDAAQLLAGVYAAVGVPHGQTPDPAEHPILGYYLDASDQRFLLYLITPGRFIRYEVDNQSRSLTIAVPVHRVSRVVERTGPSSVIVTVELDADTETTISEYRESTDETDSSVLVGRAAGKVVRTLYEMTAETPEQGYQLMAFALALRNTIGI